MAEIRSFRGLRFSNTAGPIGTLTAPPYDVISPAEREELASRNPYNVVHLTLPESKEDDRSQFVKYARSAANLAQWRHAGILGAEPRPAIYRYTQQFSLDSFKAVPAGQKPELYERTSFIALLKLEPYAAGIVLPHEQTFPKHKEDRLRILEATNSHLECIFGLYEDPSGDILKLLTNAPAGQAVTTTSDDGVFHKIEPISDEAATAQLAAALKPNKVWIADGHHRYETALNFRAAKGEQPGPIAEDYMMMAFSSMSDPGLVLLPTHRIVKNLAHSGEKVKEILSVHFEIVDTPSEAIPAKLDDTPHAFGIVGPQTSFLAIPKSFSDLVASNSGEASQGLKSLDVTVLHSTILPALGINGTEGIAYTRDPKEAISAPAQGPNTFSFLMTPPSIEEMRTIALGGEKMPQKSTYYFPKILSGLVLWSLGDFSP